MTFLVVACGSATLQAQTLSLAYATGDAYSYSVHVAGNETMTYGSTAIPVNLDMSARETLTVKSVDSRGVAEITLTTSSVTMTMPRNGVNNTTTGLTTPPVDMKVAADGTILSVNGTSVGGGSLATLSGSLSGTFVSAVLPDKPVKLGDTWSKDYDQTFPGGDGTIHVATTSKYLRNESVNGVNTAVVETNSTTTFNLTIDLSKTVAGSTSPFPMLPSGSLMQGMTMSGTYTSDVTTWFDPAVHRLVRSHLSGTTDATMTFKISAGAIMPLTGPISIKGTQTLDLNAV